MYNDKQQVSTPLVSVGMPTYNRPQGLKRALESILGQTYKNLEVIVSDNGSSIRENDGIMKDIMIEDPRVVYHRQEYNKGLLYNFNFVLEQAKGSYFMWAADDDFWEPFYIQKCLEEFNRLDDSYVAVMMETQYISPCGKYEFFPMGTFLYESDVKEVLDRLVYILDYHYDILLYSLFNRTVLLDNGKSVFGAVNPSIFNEIPFFLNVALKGQWRVLPQIGFYKKTNDLTYAQAKWEYTGGKLPNSDGAQFEASLPSIYEYHQKALMSIKEAIEVLDLDDANKVKLTQKAEANIWKHFSYFKSKSKPQRI